MATHADEPLDPDDPIPGTSHGRVALVVGLLFLVGILVALVWFGIANSDTREGDVRLIGYSGGSGAQLSWSPTAVAVRASVPAGSSSA